MNLNSAFFLYKLKNYYIVRYMGILLYTYMHIDLYTYLQDADHESSQGQKQSLLPWATLPQLHIYPYGPMRSSWPGIWPYINTKQHCHPLRVVAPLFPRTCHFAGAQWAASTGCDGAGGHGQPAEGHHGHGQQAEGSVGAGGN